ncbi:anhydro-N-acetylmuramic acid kinase [Motiliproteus coralliicola]|uniref:Anhydro-N-acetylmuramic acid kinase n=1 Tax=Motiliproteus coralliicola TaxID=2283196 RepID=A0A369WEX6_9GAMM|nr:anhydro-N-acetylmuramic acid kinase [Motiliproteus coralliicola]RDE18015.1 anhydro-N-acetylmuramic acid kinase [Motiliproteus coralliicola]
MAELSGYFIGLMSGTSLDGIDAVIVRLDSEATAAEQSTRLELIDSISQPLPTELRQQILQLTQPGDNEIELLGQVDVAFSRLQAEIVNQLLQQSGIKPEQIRAIGSHGQTLRHRPEQPIPFTLQVGDPNTLAEATGICVVADVRRRDLAAGGQGAPLVPAFHAQLFRHPEHQRAIVNIGGMANVTLLPADASSPVIGYDTGPGNVLLDSWIQRHQQQPFDRNGDWAGSGRCDQQLLQQLLSLDYFRQPAPKSTGREQFNIDWLDQQLSLQSLSLRPEDVQATLLEFSARTIADALQQHQPGPSQLFVCGGGAHNQLLMLRLQNLLPKITLSSTATLGLEPDWVEACAFAWLAQRCLAQLPGNLPAVTGARGERILGGIYPA